MATTVVTIDSLVLSESYIIKNMYKQIMPGVYSKYDNKLQGYKGRKLIIALTVLVFLGVLSMLGN